MAPNTYKHLILYSYSTVQHELLAFSADWSRVSLSFDLRWCDTCEEKYEDLGEILVKSSVVVHFPTLQLLGTH